MGYRLKRDETVEDGIRRIALEQIDKALAEIDDDSLDRHETVHQVRKRCKKLRGLVRLVRPVFPAYRCVNACYRDAAGELSFIRDAQAIIETFDDLVESAGDTVDPGAFQSIRDELVSRRDESDAGREAVESAIAGFRDMLVASRDDIDGWRLEADSGRAVCGGAKKTYKRARKAMLLAREQPTTAAFHEWRKRVKYHWYHAKLLQGCWPKLVKAWAREAKKLADRLGDEHDLAVLHERLIDQPEKFGDRETLQVFSGLIERRRATLRAAAYRRGRFLHVDKPGAFERRIRVYVDAWKETTDPLSQPAPPDVG